MKKYSRFKILIILLFVGILLHFVAHTFITYKLWIDSWKSDLFWQWKEIIVILLWLFLIFKFWKTINILKNNSFLKSFLISLLIVSLILFVLQMLNFWNFYNFIISYKYILFAFVIFWVIVLQSQKYSMEVSFSLEKTIFSIVKIILILGCVWYLLLLIYPEFLTFLWYNLHIDNITWTANSAPQWLYKTQMRTGNIRNQSIFSGPLSWWFFLMLVWPWFVAKIRKFWSLKPQKVFSWNNVWYLVFALNIFITFSRSAQLVRVLQTIILFIYYKNLLPKFKRKHFFIVSSFLIISVVIGLFYTLSSWKIKFLEQRETSDWWHIEFLYKWFQMFKSEPLTGYGAGSVGPASYFTQKEHFNPENQYLQLALEYWIFGMLMRLVLFLSFPILLYKKTGELFWFVSWGGIALSGLVLHSFSDTMSMYLFMIIAGISYTANTNKKQIFTETLEKV